VALTPGIDFGENNTAKFVRIAYTKEEYALREGIRRIKDHLMK